MDFFKCLENDGWINKTESFRLRGAKDTYGYEKDNYYMIVCAKHTPYTIEMIFRDPSIELDRFHNAERFNLMFECENITDFRTMCKLLKINLNETKRCNAAYY